MPYKTRLSSLRSFPDCFNRMDLIRSKQNQTFCILIQHRVSGNHLMSLWNAQNALCKIYIICYRIIFFIQPSADKLWIQFRIRSSTEIFGIHAIADDKHLNSGENAGKLTLTNIFFYLPESIHIRMLLIFQFYMNHRQTVDHKGYIKTSVLSFNLCILICQCSILVDHFIDTAATCNMLMVHHHKMQLLCITLHMNHDLAIFTYQPFTGFIEG